MAVVNIEIIPANQIAGSEIVGTAALSSALSMKPGVCDQHFSVGKQKFKTLAVDPAEFKPGGCN